MVYLHPHTSRTNVAPLQNGSLDNCTASKEVKNSACKCFNKKRSTFLLLNSVSVSKLNEFIKDNNKSSYEEV